MRQFARAREDFEQAARSGYRSARLDLALLFSQPDTGMMDERKAVSLFRQAWADGVTVAAYELGRLYERGISTPTSQGGGAPGSDAVEAWSWYEKGATAGDPNALARLGAREDERAAAASASVERNADWIRSFKYYASAAERARFEDWPDETWRPWRYRRASLARFLAREKMTAQVANEFAAVRSRYASP
jgi:TPR repeat protein